jgi:hypothetical protein
VYGAGKGQANNCRSAAPYTGNVTTRDAEACLKLEPAEMKNIADEGKTGVNSWVKAPFTDKSFGNAANLPVAPAALGPFVTVEVTNPIDIVVAGNSSSTFAQMTVTTFVEIKKAANVPADTVVAGRGRLTVGPIAAAAQQL